MQSKRQEELQRIDMTFMSINNQFQKQNEKIISLHNTNDHLISTIGLLMNRVIKLEARQNDNTCGMQYINQQCKYM